MKIEIINYLDELFKDPKPELIYHNDYELLIAVMLSAHSKDSMVNKVTAVLYSKYPDINSLANASLVDVQNIIRPLGTYNVKSKNVIAIANELIRHSDGKVINDRDFLESLPGVGHKTANVVLALLYDEACFAVDTHVARVSKRLKIANLNDNNLTIEKKLENYFKGHNINKLHHQILLFGRYHCKALKPLCENCKLKNACNKNT